MKMSFKQFVAAEGGRVAKLVAGSLAVGAGAHSIEKDVRRLKKTRCCAKIKHNYRQMAKRHHTDKNGKQEDFIELTNAKEEALATCDNSACRSKKPIKHIKSAKKRAKAARRAKKKEKRRHNKSDSPEMVNLGGAALVAGGIVYVATRKSKKKIKHLRQRSDEDYERVTGHARRG